MTVILTLGVNLVLWFARQLSIPVEVRQALFIKGIKSKMSGSSLLPMRRADL